MIPAADTEQGGHPWCCHYHRVHGCAWFGREEKASCRRRVAPGCCLTCPKEELRRLMKASEASISGDKPVQIKLPAAVSQS